MEQPDNVVYAWSPQTSPRKKRQDDKQTPAVKIADGDKALQRCLAKIKHHQEEEALHRAQVDSWKAKARECYRAIEEREDRKGSRCNQITVTSPDGLTKMEVNKRNQYRPVNVQSFPDLAKAIGNKAFDAFVDEVWKVTVDSDFNYEDFCNTIFARLENIVPDPKLGAEIADIVWNIVDSTMDIEISLKVKNKDLDKRIFQFKDTLDPEQLRALNEFLVFARYEEMVRVL